MPDYKPDVPTVSKYEHEKALMHYGMVNKRSMIALITVCVTFVLITLTFVVAYTVREKNWLETIAHLKTPVVTEVSDNDGIYQQSDP